MKIKVSEVIRMIVMWVSMSVVSIICNVLLDSIFGMHIELEKLVPECIIIALIVLLCMWYFKYRNNTIWYMEKKDVVK